MILPPCHSQHYTPAGPKPSVPSGSVSGTWMCTWEGAWVGCRPHPCRPKCHGWAAKPKGNGDNSVMTITKSITITKPTTMVTCCSNCNKYWSFPCKKVESGWVLILLRSFAQARWVSPSVAGPGGSSCAWRAAAAAPRHGPRKGHACGPYLQEWV